MVGVLEEAGEHLHHPRVEAALISGERLPVRDVGIGRGEFCCCGNQAELLLPVEHLPAIGLPAGVELAGVAVGPLLRHMVGGVHRTKGEVQEERLVRSDLLGVGDHRRGLLDQVGGQVVALLRSGLGFGLGVVPHEFGVVLVGVAAEEAVVALESTAQRPAVIGARRGHRLFRGQVPFPDAVGVVALCPKDFGEEAVLERDVAV